MVQTRSKGAQSKDDEATSRSRRDEKLSGPLGGTFFKVTTVIALFLSYIAAIYEAPVDVEAATKKYSDFTGTFEPNVLLRQSYVPTHYSAALAHYVGQEAAALAP
jgi:hypothetical protein